MKKGGEEYCLKPFLPGRKVRNSLVPRTKIRQLTPLKVSMEIAYKLSYSIHEHILESWRHEELISPSIQPNHSLIFVDSVLGAEPPGKTTTSDTPHCPTMLPTNCEDVTIRTPVDCTHRSRRGMRVHIWHGKNLRLRGKPFCREARNFN